MSSWYYPSRSSIPEPSQPTYYVVHVQLHASMPQRTSYLPLVHSIHILVLGIVSMMYHICCDRLPSSLCGSLCLGTIPMPRAIGIGIGQDLPRIDAYSLHAGGQGIYFGQHRAVPEADSARDASRERQQSSRHTG